jgi:TRAP-type uncharacterized transport system fused permease subunit
MKNRANPEEKRSQVRSILGRWIAISLSVFTIYAMITLRVQELQLLAIFLSLTLALTFIHFPLHPKRPDHWPFLCIDLILSVLSFLIGLYILIEYWDFIERVGIPTQGDMVCSFIALFLILEATRRAVGWPLLIIVLVFLLYTFVGHLLPLFLSHKGYGLERITTTLFMTQNGIFGVALKTMTYFIFLFISFGE